MAVNCLAQTKAGAPCTNVALPGRLHCRFHDQEPDSIEQRREWSKRGGQERSTLKRAAKRIPPTLQGVQEVLHRALAGLESGEMEPARATAMGNVARALVTLTEAADFEQRLAELEKTAALKT